VLGVRQMSRKRKGSGWSKPTVFSVAANARKSDHPGNAMERSMSWVARPVSIQNHTSRANAPTSMGCAPDSPSAWLTLRNTSALRRSSGLDEGMEMAVIDGLGNLARPVVVEG